MAKKKNTYNKKTEVTEKKKYKNFTKSKVSKFLICFLALAMCFSGLITLIYLIVQNS